MKKVVFTTGKYLIILPTTSYCQHDALMHASMFIPNQTRHSSHGNHSQGTQPAPTTPFCSDSPPSCCTAVIVHHTIIPTANPLPMTLCHYIISHVLSWCGASSVLVCYHVPGHPCQSYIHLLATNDFRAIVPIPVACLTILPDL